MNKPKELSCLEIQEGFFLTWKSTLKGAVERLETAKVQGKVHPQKAEEVDQLIILHKNAITHLEEMHIPFEQFSEEIAEISDALGMEAK